LKSKLTSIIEGMQKATVELGEMQSEDWPAVRVIYGQGIDTGQATFETALPAWAEWDQDHLAAPRLVVRQGATVQGWAALSPVSGRCVYGGVAEVSVYVADGQRGRGLGTMLLRALIDRSEAQGIWTLQAGIFPENEASIALHLACGFRLVGVRERLGQLAGVWRNVALLERRSEVV
jgi:phosphinothricin acetyltransferase